MTKVRGTPGSNAPHSLWLLAALMAWPATAAPPGPTLSAGEVRDLHWVTVSQDAKAVLEQDADPNGCKSRCTLEGAAAPSWTSTVCLGKKLDLRFVSNDCVRFVVLHQFPEPVPNPRVAPVIQVYDRGQFTYAVQAAGLVLNWAAIRPSGKRFYWLNGAMGVAGTPPHYGAGGEAVEFETIDGKPQRVDLHGAPPAPPEEKPAPATPGAKKRRRH